MLMLALFLAGSVLGAQDKETVGQIVDKTIKQGKEMVKDAGSVMKDAKDVANVVKSNVGPAETKETKVQEAKADSILQKAGVAGATDTNSVTMSTVYKDFKAAIIAMAQTMKVGVEGLWMVLVKQQVVKAVIVLFIVIILLALFILLIVFTKIMYRRAQEHKETNVWTIFDFGTVFGVFFSFLCGIAMVWYSLANISTAATGLINPEYGAIKDVVEMVQTKNVK